MAARSFSVNFLVFFNAFEGLFSSFFLEKAFFFFFSLKKNCKPSHVFFSFLKELANFSKFSQHFESNLDGSNVLKYLTG